MFKDYVMAILNESDDTPIVGRVTDGGKRYLIKYKGKTFRIDIVNGKHRFGNKLYDDKKQVVAAMISGE